jgi:presenilin-like A22 family membrane protease
MIPDMAAEERDGVVVDLPNRHKASSKATRWMVVLLLLISAGLMLFVLIGGWSALDGMIPITVAYIAIYVILALFCARWTRGTLPIAAALGIILAIFALVAAPQWLERDQTGFTDPAVDSGLLGLICIVLAAVQLLLIAFAMRGFAQNWNVEVERRVDAPAEPRAATA